MLIAFIGAPCSGKTTTAAMVFAALKDAGQLAEFVPEQARVYIAAKKRSVFHNDNPLALPLWQVPVTLTDFDQKEIARQQSDADSLMISSSGPGTTVVADSSPLNSLFYMTDGCQDSFANHDQGIIKNAIRDTALFFYVKPIPNQALMDPNRLHDARFSKELDDRILPLLTKLCPDALPKIVPLIGHAEERKITALTMYYNHKYPSSEQ